MPRVRIWPNVGIAIISAALLACAPQPPAPSGPTKVPIIGGTLIPDLGGDRPADLYLPPSYVEGEPAPLLVLLHGYGASNAMQEAYFKLAPAVARLGFLYIIPNGTFDSAGQRFWNATDACCNFHGSDVDDIAYLMGLIQEVERTVSVDPARVFIVGYSNGGFMAQRLACEFPGRFAAVVSIAGAQSLDASDCQPAHGLHFLQIHGTADPTILYKGGKWFGGSYPSARDTTQSWVNINGCDKEPTTLPPINLESAIPGRETIRERWAGCEPGTSVALWTIQGGTHVPVLSPECGDELLSYLMELVERPVWPEP